MFAKTIIDSDAFLDMPLSAQSLYFHLSMRGDDDGFVNNPKKVQRMIGASDDDLKLLIVKKFIIPFESGIVVIKHWRIHNYIQKDRYKPTVYQEEMKRLQVKKNGGYTLTDANCIQDVSIADTQVRLEIVKDSIDKNIGDKPQQKRFIPPTLEEVTSYCQERKNGIDPQKFIDHYTANGWMRGKTKIKDWKACIRTWEGNNKVKPMQPSQQKPPNAANFKERQYDDDFYEKLKKAGMK